MPRLSVVIPTFNRAALVARAIASAQAQTEPDIEILVVDDGSRDDTARVVGEIAARDSRVRHLPKANGGVSTARNLGIERASAPFVGLLDSDDAWEPRFVASQIALLEGHPDAALALCDSRPMNPPPDGPPSQYAEPDYIPPLSADAMFDGAWARPSTWCLRREAAARLRFRAECRICEDTDFLFRLLLGGDEAVLNPELLAVWGEDVGPGLAPRLSTDGLRLTGAHNRLLERYLPQAPDRRRAHKRLFRRRRHLAVDLVRQGRRREARALLWGWWKVRPLHLGVLKDLLLSFVKDDPPTPGQGTTASASTSIKA